MDLIEIEFVGINKEEQYIQLINKVIEKCFEVEGLLDKKLMINMILTTPENIRKYNREFRNIDKATDVLSFPMFEKGEIEQLKQNENVYLDILGDIIISIDQVQQQAKEYQHTVERELSYMVVHGFYHLMGYDHIKQEDKDEMRPKEEYILNSLKITRQEE